MVLEVANNKGVIPILNKGDKMKEIFERTFKDIETFNRFQSVLLKPIEVINIQYKGESPYGEWLVIWYREI
jgi:hypothetical protein